MLDLAVEFERLHEFECINDFMEYLQKENSINKDYNVLALAYAEQELAEKAEILGVKLLEKGMVAVDRKEYGYLKRVEKNWRKHQRDLKGWPF